MSTAKSFNRAGKQPGPVSIQQELARLRASRPKPAPERHLTPGGSLEQQVKRGLNTQRETRIQELTIRSRTLSEQTKTGFARARDKGRAKGAFERSR
ncbi:hypothetical protein [Kordiimonas sp.]|uniref:hypothetical protein n=1 Tax=Kordiimonas sp. TaxID=1970157 RepID=UPI003A8CC6F0